MITFDQIDLILLDELQRDSKQSVKELARKIEEQNDYKKKYEELLKKTKKVSIKILKTYINIYMRFLQFMLIIIMR